MEQKRLVNLVLWPVALLVLNSLWMSVAGGVAPYEINDVDQDIETRTVELESVFGLTKEMPAEMEVEFTGVSVDDGTVSWTIRDAANNVIAQWTGLLSEGPPNWSGALEPGTYTVETTVDEGIVAEQVLQIQPFESYRLEGTYHPLILPFPHRIRRSVHPTKSRGIHGQTCEIQSSAGGKEPIQAPSNWNAG